jgi:hypothetical protein
MLDRHEELLLLPLRVALRERPNGQAPVDALRGLVDRLSEQKDPFVRVDSRAIVWWRVVKASTSLQARLHELEDEAAEGLALELAGPKPDGLARLKACMVVVTVRTAREETVRVFERGGSAKKANAAFLALMDRGFAAVSQMAGSSERAWRAGSK